MALLPATDRWPPGSRVAVTGGCGFIGSHVVAALVSAGVHRVVVVDNGRSGSEANLAAARGHVTLVPHDLGRHDRAALAPHLDGVEHLFHLAAVKLSGGTEDPEEMISSNVLGTLALLDAATRAGVRRVVFASSLYVYGRLRGRPCREDDPPAPRTLYGLTKLTGERLLHAFHERHGLEFAALRFFFVYGPRQSTGAGYRPVIVKTLERLARGEAPVIFGDGTQALDYLYVEDAARAAIMAMRSPACAEVFNVGSGRAVTVSRLMEALIRVSGRRVRPVHAAADWTAGTRRVADVRRVRAALGWAPRVTLTQGLRRTQRWLGGR
jgi:UDP-glucose 4-epimerase